MGTCEKVHTTLFYFKGSMLRCWDVLKGKCLILKNLRHSTQTCYHHTFLSFSPLWNNKMSLLPELCIFNVSFSNLKMPAHFWDILVILLRERIHEPDIFPKPTGLASPLSRKDNSVVHLLPLSTVGRPTPWPGYSERHPPPFSVVSVICDQLWSEIDALPSDIPSFIRRSSVV